MHLKLEPIALNEASYDVALLHKILEVFGLRVAKEETQQHLAGEDTQTKLRTLQAKLNVPVDEALLVDDITAAAIGEALRKRGLLRAKRSFSVSGTVRRPDRAPKRRQRLVAFDLDLRAVGIYREVETLAEVAKAGGFECLGTTTSDQRGRYELTFYDWQYRRAERRLADVVVYAVALHDDPDYQDDKPGKGSKRGKGGKSGKSGGRILGRSRLVASGDYSEKGLVQDLDITMAEPDRGTEYDAIMTPLNAFLKESELLLHEIAPSTEQLAFAASELDLDLDRLNVAAAAALLAYDKKHSLPHELLYALGRQNVRLDWAVLYRKPAEELRVAITRSVQDRIVLQFNDKQIADFLGRLRERATEKVLDDEPAGDKNTVNAMLSSALPEAPQRLAFMGALAAFRGDDGRDFWRKTLPAQPEFEGKPELIGSLLLNQQLTVLTGDHQALVRELQVVRGLASVQQLLDLEDDDWREIVTKAGAPTGVPGDTVEARARAYAAQLQNLVNTAFATQRIARMVDKNQLPIEKTSVAAGMAGFLAQNAQFDFSRSRIHDFSEEIVAAAPERAAEVTHELLKIQRVFQVSTSPATMTALLNNGLHSAYSIVNVPRKSFVKTYGNVLGGEQAAYAVHQRASHIATRAELSAMHMFEYSHSGTPVTAMGPAEYTAAMALLESRIPNYAELFGRPDICECEHCRSVYSAAAYFIDLLRFLRHGEPNANGKTPLDLLTARRPDLLHLPLNCENTNTIIPYIDLVNEVMEYFAANDSLIGFEGHDTGEATEEELRANPQNFILKAYRKLKDAKYPFTLPYHQPLDVIRTYSDHFAVTRYDAMRAMQPVPDAAAAHAIAAESLRLSKEEYKVLAGAAFDGSADTTALHAYYGYTAAGQLENLSAVPEFLHRSGVSYTELVELVKTRFLNPHQGTLDFLEKIFAHASIDASTIYTRLGQIEARTLDPATAPDISAALDAYNTAEGTAIMAAEFGEWVVANLAEFRQVITLYEPDSKCDLETTRLRTIRSIYESAPDSGLSNDDWSKAHRFIRLWRKLGWTIHETDLMLIAIGESDLRPQTVAKLESVAALKEATKLELTHLAVLWGSIDTYGSKSLYRKLFLNKTMQQTDNAFKADAWGDHLQDPAELLDDHRSAILAAFRIREEDLSAVLGVVEVIDGGNPRAIDMATDSLNLGNLSTLYRPVVLAKALKMRIPDLCTLIALFDRKPFSAWDVQQQAFTNIDPAGTDAFFQLAQASKQAGFKASVLQYVLQGRLPAESTLGLDADNARQTAKAVRDTFIALEQDHPDAPPSPLSAEIMAGKLALTFQPEIVTRFLGMLDRTIAFESLTDANLGIAIPEALADKYVYVKGSGRLSCIGVMSDDERATLKGLANVNAAFENAVDELYQAPEDFIGDNFEGVFADLAKARIVLLDHPKQAAAVTDDEKLAYVYEQFVPVLKGKLRRDAITQHVADLIGLSDAATTILIADEIDALVSDLSTQGFSATYFSDATWTNPALDRTDATVDFAWGAAAPHPTVPADGFSVRWDSYVVAPASGEYTLLVDVEEADEQFRLYLDDILVLEKTAADAGTSWEVVTSLNAPEMHRLKLEYAEVAQNAGVRLQWKTATSAREVLPAAAAYPAAVLDAFVALAVVYHRAAKFISGFALSETELNHLHAFAGDFAGIDFKALTGDHWQRVHAYTELRNAVPQAQALLTDVFAAATASPAPTLAELKTLLRQATAWDELNLDFLVDTRFALATADFKNEIALNRLRAVMEISAGTGLSAETVAAWGTVGTAFDALNATAQLMKNTVKAKYEEQDWLALAGDLSDAIREHQKQALIAYLLTSPALRAWGAHDADGLFEYFLIDVQMGACMDTSRIVQANSAVQMFVNRCLLNLESDTTGGPEKGVSPGAIDKERWEWMRNYRVWEVNRKVFLYPEDLLEPEWRNDRSEFFRELESHLVQNDITDRSVEQGFRNYLASLNEVANLDVCGLHRENYDDGSLRYMHVFARTHNLPYKYYYRRWNEYRKWSAWERVPLDIRGVETTGSAGGENSGVQLVPVVWKKRLFLFWPEFMQVAEAPGGTTNKAMEDVGDDKISTLESNHILEIRLAWSEYVDQRWTPKHVSKEYLRELTHNRQDKPTIEKDFLLTPSIVSDTMELKITVSDSWNLLRGKFILADIQSPIRVQHFRDHRSLRKYDYRYVFGRRKAGKPLELMDDVYLNQSTNHMLLPVDTYKGLNIQLDDPFFFSDSQRTYFVRPVDITIIERLKNPGMYLPYLPGLAFAADLTANIDLPDLGGDAFIPVGDFGPGLAGGAAMTIGDLASLEQPARAVSIANESPLSKTYGAEIARVDQAFGGATVGVIDWGIWAKVRHDKGLEFHTFYHPYSGEYVRKLNRGGLPGLMEADTSLPSDDGDTFEDAYDPNFTYGFVQKPADFADRTYYKENVCFDVYGANSLYNWEQFFHAPLYIATRLSRNGKFEEAMKWFHFIFDPTTDELPGPGESEVSRYWKVLPYKTTPADTLEDWFRRSLSPNANPDTENAVIAEWRDFPFDPHRVAANRPLAYMKHVVIKYVENLIAWGDFLFRQDTMESVNEALQIYVIANAILGPKPEFVPKRGTLKAESYASLEDRWDDFSNALVELENIFPYSSDAAVSLPSIGTSLLGVGSALYFCIPPNDKLTGYWETVGDRLYKIRHCQNIDGVERRLALFAPPIEPGALIQAASQGLSLGSILADLSSPPPIYRFTFLIQKANEFCGDVKALGSALLTALEKKDAEELSRMRASHESQLLELITTIRERQVLDARSFKEQLEKSREVAAFRLTHYTDLLGNDTIALPAPPAVSGNLTSDSQLPADTLIATVQSDVDDSLVGSGESGVKLIPRENEQLSKNIIVRWTNAGVSAGETIATVFNMWPTYKGLVAPLGVGVGTETGGFNWAGALSAAARAAKGASDEYTAQGLQASLLASYIRREQDWTLQANLAAKEIIQLDKQITAADIRIQIAEKELENHKQQIENAKMVEQFLKGKFTNQELYQWMKEQLFAVYKQAYNLAYDMARKVEKAYKYELGTELASFIQYGYWDDSRQGLVAGEKLQLALRQMEKSYLEENRRELELSKNVSLARLNPQALIELRETGKCYVSLPEELFDLDFRGHYFRRIRAVRMSIPCVAGPHTSVSCSLRLLNNRIRINTAMNSEGKYEHENDEGLWIDDDRFRVNHVPVKAIATSLAQNDSGMFEFSFRDERYLPFERAGAISEWEIELSTDAELRPFDYATISDVILNLSYTAREQGGLFKESASTYVKDFLANAADLADQPLVQMFTMRHEYPTEWHRFLHPAVAGDEQVLAVTLGRQRFPYLVQNRTIVVMQIQVFARCTGAGDYHMLLSHMNFDGDPVNSSQISVPKSAAYGDLNVATVGITDAGLNLEELDVAGPMTLKLKHNATPDYTGLATDPPEIEDLVCLVHYKLD